MLYFSINLNLVFSAVFFLRDTNDMSFSSTRTAFRMLCVFGKVKTRGNTDLFIYFPVHFKYI